MQLGKERFGSNAIRRNVLQGDKLIAHTTYFDDASLERNKQIRNANLLAQGRLGLHDNEDIRFVISCPSVAQWSAFKKKYPEVYGLLKSKDEADPMSGAKQLQILEPAWVVQERL